MTFTLADTSLLVAKITFVVAEITIKVAMITSSVTKITCVVTEITFKVGLITSSVAKITFVVAEITFIIEMITSSLAKITFVVAEITLRIAVNSLIVVHFVFNRNKILCIHVKALDSSLLLTDVKDVCTFFFYFGYPVLIGQKCETLSIFPGWKKSDQILYPTQKLWNMFK